MVAPIANVSSATTR